MLYSHLLVPSDGSELSARAVDQALALASALGARITFLHAQPRAPLPVVGMGEILDARTIEALIAAGLRESDHILSQASEAAAAAGVAVSCERVNSDLPHRAIVETAARLGCDLIVMASHGRRGLGGLLLGSETQRVLVQSSCPVLVVREAGGAG
ncbi:MAG: universal stress protein [Cyanobacteriota bacterium]|jgi:nucleotide-binding universal stress UspA family protein